MPACLLSFLTVTLFDTKTETPFFEALIPVSGTKYISLKSHFLYDETIAHSKAERSLL